MKFKDKEYYTIQEFADKIGACYRTIYKGIKNGQIEAFRIGRGRGATYRICHTEFHRLGVFNLDDVISNKINMILEDREKHGKTT